MISSSWSAWAGQAEQAYRQHGKNIAFHHRSPCWLSKKPRRARARRRSGCAQARRSHAARMAAQPCWISSSAAAKESRKVPGTPYGVPSITATPASRSR
ncbi:Uncharacterised protein [Bordetella pertussis]|nr:Uncharacterised protein [Bordetella pertussis]